MQINLSVFATGETILNNKLRYKAYETSSPNIAVAELTEDPPHDFPHAVSLYVPNPVPHIVKIFSTPDDSDGVKLTDILYDPTYTNVEVRLPLELSVNGSGEFDPAEGTQAIPVNPSLRGWDWYPEMRSKSGTVHSSEYIKTESIPGQGYDSFSLIGEDTFYAPDYIFIHFEPKLSVSQPVFTYLNLFNGVKTITGDVTIDSTYYRMLIEIATAGPSPVISLPPKATVPDNTLLVFSTKRGAQKQATIKAFSGETIECDNESYPAIFSGQGEVIWVLMIDNIWRVTNDWNGMQKVGIQIDMEVVRPNTIIFNGGGLTNTGGNPTPLPRAQYPRAEWYVFNKLLPGQLLTKATRDAGGIDLSGFWAYDDNNIYAPDYRGNQKRALPGNRGNDSTRDNTDLSGSYRGDRLKGHRHFTVIFRTVNQSPFPPSPSDETGIVREWVKDGGSGAPGYYLVGGNINEEPNIGITSMSSNDTETIGKTNGVLVGCYI